MPTTATLDRPVHLLSELHLHPCAAPSREQCATCRVSALCLPGGLTEGDLRPLDALVLTTRKVKAGQSIFCDGDSFRHVFAVRSGTCKTSMVRVDGREQVVGFHMAGEVMGLDAIAGDVHRTSATALEDGEVCLIPYRRLLAVTAATPGSKDLLSHLMSLQIVRDTSVMAMLGLTDSRDRLAAFLVNLSERHAARGWSPREFQLRMSRGDIASFLGVQVETISRTLSLFERRGLVAVSGRHLRITALEALKREYELRLR